MFALRSPWLRVMCLSLLGLGMLLRPVLIIACEVHAVTHAHAADPHDHSHDADSHGDGDGDGDGHGAHDQQLLGSLAGAAASPVAFDLVSPRFGPQPLPAARAAAPPEHARSVPFRPPIV